VLLRALLRAPAAAAATDTAAALAARGRLSRLFAAKADLHSRVNQGQQPRLLRKQQHSLLGILM